jgi:hypothetical protein
MEYVEQIKNEIERIKRENPRISKLRDEYYKTRVLFRLAVIYGRTPAEYIETLYVRKEAMRILLNRYGWKET